jgi:non-homologous end joining protein Ku
LIDAKLEKRPPKDIEEPQTGAQVIDLMQALKRSVGGKNTGASGGKRRTKRSAAKSAKRSPSKRKAA